LKLNVPREGDGEIEVSATLAAGGKEHRLWWRVPGEWAGAVTTWADPFVVGMVFLMMEAREEVRIEGAASPSLLENLERYMDIWRVWDPPRYAVVKIRADREEESPGAEARWGGEMLTTFSGGVDSCYTLARHLDKAVGRRNRKIGAALVINGFDIWPDQKNAAGIFEGVRRGVLAQLGAVGVAPIVVSTNFHELPVTWADAFGTELASGLMLFGKRFAGAVLPNSHIYAKAGERWGSTPLADPFLGSRHFPILDDGGGAGREEKLEYLGRHPELLAQLRVCFPLDGRFENCCRCEKCLRTIVGCHVAGVAVPATAFPRAVTAKEIAGMKFHSTISWTFWRELLEAAEARGLMGEAWAQGLATAVRRGARRYRMQQLKKPLIPLRNRLRKLLRGSAENRSKLRRKG